MRSSFIVTSNFLKRSLLFFWAAWFSVVTATNACDGLKEIGLLGPGWRFASGNFDFLTETTARYDIPAWLNAVLFAGVVAWEATAAALFWLAWGQSRHVGESLRDSTSRLGETRPSEDAATDEADHGRSLAADAGHVTPHGSVKDIPLLYPAFFVGSMLWAAFALADELLIAYPVESTHLRLFTAQLATLLAIVLVPETGERPSGHGRPE